MKYEGRSRTWAITGSPPPTSCINFKNGKKMANTNSTKKSLLSPRLRKMTTKQFRRYLEDREKGHQKKLAALEKKLDRRRQEIFNTIFKIFRP